MTDEQDNEPLHAPDLVMDVENFGPIAEARNIAFKPMTVFVGPSNTGKSYLALLLHSILRGLGEDALFRHLPRVAWNPRTHAAELVELFRETDQLATQALDSLEPGDPDEVGIDSFTPATRSFLQDSVESQLRRLAGSLASSICEQFDVGDVTELANHGNRCDTVPNVILRDRSPVGQWDFGFGPGGPHFEVGYEELAWSAQTLAWVVERIERDNLDGPANRVSGRLLRTYLTELVRRITQGGESWYFPASRTGILMSHRVLTGSIVSNAHKSGRYEGALGKPPYHKIAADFLSAINAIEPESQGARNGSIARDFDQRSRIAKTIEQSVLYGTIDVELHEFGPPEFKFEPDGYSGLKVPMMRSSSMATELAPIVALLRSLITKGDLLIIEEPEAHMHPAAQQRMAGILAYMVRKGLRVLITTHSHYMVEALGMFVNSSYVDPEKRPGAMQLLGQEVDRDLFLTEDEVAVYSFDTQAGSGGTVVKPVPFDAHNYSFDPKGYSDALVDEFNRISRVFNASVSADDLAEST